MKLFVWDFHGVLEKGNEGAVVEISNLALSDLGHSARLTEDQCRILYGKKWYEYFQALLPDEQAQVHLELQEICFDYSRDRSDIVKRHMQPNDHIHQVLEAIAKDHEQIVISNTPPEHLQFFLDAVGIAHHFPKDRRFALDSHKMRSRKTKSGVLIQFLQDKKDKEDKRFDEIIIIGDSPDDMVLKTAVAGKTYLYTHPGKTHPDCQADSRIHDLRELLNEL